MTDTSAGRGGVGIRLYTTGGDVVKRSFDQVGDSGRKMWAEIATGSKAGNPAIRALSLGVGEAKSGIDGLASRAGPAAGVLGAFGAAGLAAAAGLGGMAIALGKAQDAMKMAAELTDTADRIGVGVEQLQAWNYVADEAGVSTTGFQANLEKLNGTLGAFKAGIGDGKLKPVFEELGITPAQLKDVQTADQLMLILADTLGQVKDRALQVKFARSLGVEESLPILRLGSDGVRDLTLEAERLGLVMGKDVVQALDEADRKLEVAQQRIDATVRLAVAGLAEDFATLVGQIAGAVVQLARWDAQVSRLSGAGQRPGRSLPSIISDNLRGRSAAEGEAARDQGALNQGGLATWLGFNQPRLEAMEGERRRREDILALALGTGIHAPPGGEFEPRGHTSRGGGTKSSGDADRLNRERERATQSLDREVTGARRDVTRQRWDDDTPEDRAQLAKSMLAIEQKERDAKRVALAAELDRTNGITDAVKVQLEQLVLLDQESDALADRAIIENLRKETAAAALERDQQAGSDAIDVLSIQREMAITARDRFVIGRQILEAEQELRREALAAKLRLKGIVAEDDAAYQDLLKTQTAEDALYEFNEEDRLREQFRAAGEEVVHAIEDGKIGDLIADRLKSRLLDMALDGLFDFMAGGAKKEGGGFLGSLVNFGSSLFTRGGGRASGGDVRDGFVYGMAEHGPELALFGTNGQVMNHAETVDMLRGFAGAGGQSAAPAAAPVFRMPDITIYAQGADAAGLKRVENEVRELNRTLEIRAVEAVADYRQRSHG